ncbi:CarboxypepD_reg-like domain-containing protein [Mucilaginibacter pineti]|uniref:CarboxypepD_reg-like domain-containing protein n=1 Tax=Mucilaginibacter pineti TaxID=1391627 RepID=A0A1G7K6F8_9SPHI|nr:carboxypeptidase-like regulatory domain-containing protein [Mucilaginibacter pineti]SDF32742.1 CarboxypepD_reg-like domain-containing protein [Mucilaginibacter pineti]
MKKLILLLLFIIPSVCFAQITITGKILYAKDNTAFPYASVFLSNTTIGTKTYTDGTFTLPDIKPGKYTLVVTAVGYEQYSIELLLDKNLQINDVKLVEKPIELENVVIKFDPNREKYMNMFMYEFVGRSENAKKCKILNPEIIHFKLNKKTNMLTATANDFIELENESLGYKINYLLKVFEISMTYWKVSYSGDFKFEKMDGPPKAQEKWEKKRKETYKGSAKHFYKSLIAGDFKEQGFDVYTVARENKPQFPDSNLISRLIVKDTLRIKNDTNSYWQRQPPPMANTTEKIRLIEPKLNLNQISCPTDIKGIYGLRFDELLKYVMFVVYSKKSAPAAVFDFVNTRFQVTKPASFIVFDKPYALFDSNGIITSKGSISYSGYWSEQRIGDLLPADYLPTD